jgi:periplasmic protein TonB
VTAQSVQSMDATWLVLVRAAVFGIGAAAITVALLWAMQYLVATGVDAVTEERTFRFVDFVRVQRDERVQTRDERVERVPDAQAPPLMESRRHFDDMDGDVIGVIGVAAPRISHDVSVRREGFFSDGDYMPIVQVAPQYPPRAADLGMEGFVLLEFTVTSEGTVRDPRVIESSNAIFDRAATDAVLRFRYRPRVIGGEPVEVPGVRFRITFEIWDAGSAPAQTR